jgi:hypothetical protein
MRYQTDEQICRDVLIILGDQDYLNTGARRHGAIRALGGVAAVLRVSTRSRGVAEPRRRDVDADAAQRLSRQKTKT